MTNLEIQTGLMEIISEIDSTSQQLAAIKEHAMKLVQDMGEVTFKADE